MATKPIYVNFNYGGLLESKPTAYNLSEKIVINGVDFGFRWGAIYDPRERFDGTANTYSPNTGNDYFERKVALSETQPSPDIYNTTTQFHNVALQNWTVRYVDVGYQVPTESRAAVAEFVIDTLMDGLKSFASGRGLTSVIFFLDRLDQILSSRSLHDVVADHYQDQFGAMNKALNGEISVNELLGQSNNLAQRHTSDLLVEAGVNAETAALFQQVAYVHSPPSSAGFALPNGGLDDGSVRALAPTGTGGVTVNGSFQNNVFVGGSGPDVARLGEGNDIALGGDGADQLYGGLGDDRFAGGRGSDLMQGDEGSDTVYYTTAFRQHLVLANPGNRTILSTAGELDTLIDIEEVRFLDGRLTSDLSDPAAVVLRMFDSAFNRAPDSFGLNGWISQIQGGAGPANIATAFASSAEFNQTYGALNNQAFVQQLYMNVINRPSEPTGLAAWTNALDTGALNRGQVLAGFSESAEHVALTAPSVRAGIWDVDDTAASIARLYHAALDRPPEANGLMGWKAYIDGGGTLANAADVFAVSPEFLAKYGNLSNEAYVEQLYGNVLERRSDPQGLADWAAVLNNGQMDRGDVLIGFSESFEHQIRTVTVVTDGILFA